MLKSQKRCDTRERAAQSREKPPSREDAADVVQHRPAQRAHNDTGRVKVAFLMRYAEISSKINRSIQSNKTEIKVK